jgi:hypothetical protein
MQNNRRAARERRLSIKKVQPREILFATLCAGDSHAARARKHAFQARFSRREDGLYVRRERDRIFPADSTTNEANNKNGRFPNLCAISGISVPNYYLNYKSRICIGKGQGASRAQGPSPPPSIWDSHNRSLSVLAVCVQSAFSLYRRAPHKEKSKKSCRGDFYILRSAGARVMGPR